MATKGIEGLPPEGPGPEGTHPGAGSMAESMLIGNPAPNTVPFDNNHQTPLNTGVLITEHMGDAPTEVE